LGAAVFLAAGRDDFPIFFLAGLETRVEALGLADNRADFLLVFFFCLAAFAILGILLKTLCCTLAHWRTLRTRFLCRKVLIFFMAKTRVMLAALCLTIACSRLQPLTPDRLAEAEGRWKMHQPDGYRLVIEISGDRVEVGRFELNVQHGRTTDLKRNNLVIRPTAGQDYSMDGLFRMLEQELGLAEKPATLGAPPGYSVYLTAEFDDQTGRLMRYRRIVGGTSNSIDVNVVEFHQN
jgi:hypothetical protein